MTGNYASFPERDQPQTLPSAHVIDGEDENEMAHMLLQHRYLSECMGGVLPASLDLSRVKRVLDANCGAGGWVYELAWKHPSMHVTGIDRRSDLTEKAGELVSLLGNATILRQDIRSLSNEVLPAASFDLVHARFLVSMLRPQEYPTILSSLVERCRMDGLLVWDELEFPVTSSPACQAFYALMQDGLKAAGRAFSPGNALGITSMMSRLMRESGCMVTLDVASAIEISSGTKGQAIFAQQMQSLSRPIRAFLLENGVTTKTFFAELCSQVQREIFSDSFFGLIYVRTLVGTRNKESARMGQPRG